MLFLDLAREIEKKKDSGNGSYLVTWKKGFSVEEGNNNLFP